MNDVSAAAWRRAPEDYGLPPDEVHVWRAVLHQPHDCMARLTQLLSAEERVRADKFHFQADRNRHIIGRAVSRILLGRCLLKPALKLQLEYNEFGKPRLAEAGYPPLEFNISHSGDLVLVALTLGRALGVDVEQMKPEMGTQEIAGRFFSPNECRVLAALPSEMQCAAFFACWTRKEAYLKGRGDGLSLPLDRFDVAFAPGQAARLLETRHDPAEADRWALHALCPGHGCKAALAVEVEGGGWKLQCWDWPPHAMPCWARDVF